jgi:hypothetical protein
MSTVCWAATTRSRSPPAPTRLRPLLRRAKTDSNPYITDDRVTRPEVSNLGLLAALSEELDPREVAEQIGSRGAVELKRRATEAVRTPPTHPRAPGRTHARPRLSQNDPARRKRPGLEALPKTRSSR